ncbi:AraC family transcriptional regulator [Zoogloea sp.]|uniref:AraC family transcriptional regulator n=1 Tax=Zoogloea sp. TaxID=49181 RepID=UPI001415D1DF|nr:MAG: AraC family transcriptional regulator [Zoogloea sp.]
METIAKVVPQELQASCNDLKSAQTWMAEICGPHGLKAHANRPLQFRHSGNVLQSRSTTIGYVEYGTDVSILVHEPTPLHSFSISLPITGEQELSVDGKHLLSNADVGTILVPNVSQELVIAGNCRKMLVSMSHAAVSKVLEELLQRPLSKPLIFSPTMDATGGETASWWRIVRHLLSEMACSQSLYRNLHLAAELETTLIRGLLLAQPNNYSEELHSSREGKTPQYLLKARRFILDTAKEDVNLEHIEQVAGVSRFKLYEGFKLYFGLTPLAYRKKHRLEQVRREILRSGSQKNISCIAMDWGFMHLGRFSIEYKKQFNELPSETLRRHRQNR